MVRYLSAQTRSYQSHYVLPWPKLPDSLELCFLKMKNEIPRIFAIGRLKVSGQGSARARADQNDNVYLTINVVILYVCGIFKKLNGVGAHRAIHRYWYLHLLRSPLEC